MFALKRHLHLSYLRGQCCTAGIRTPPVTVLTEEPVNTLLPASAYMTMEQRLPLQDPQLKVLKWTFLQHLPDSWVA